MIRKLILSAVLATGAVAGDRDLCNRRAAGRVRPRP